MMCLFVICITLQKTSRLWIKLAYHVQGIFQLRFADIKRRNQFFIMLK